MSMVSQTKDTRFAGRCHFGDACVVRGVKTLRLLSACCSDSMETVAYPTTLNIGTCCSRSRLGAYRYLLLPS